MASYSQEQKCISLIAGADLSSSQFYIVKIDGSTGKAILASSAGEAVVGVLQNAPKAGQAALICVSGVTKVKAGAAFATYGLRVQATAAGKADVATTGDFPVGRMLSTAADGDVATMLVNIGEVALA